MAKLDIRNRNDEYDEIVFHDHDEVSYVGEKITNIDDGVIYVKSNDDDKIEVNKDSVDNLIKALQKAKQLGWFE